MRVTGDRWTLKEAHRLGLCRQCGRDLFGHMPNDARCSRCKGERGHK